MATASAVAAFGGRPPAVLHSFSGPVDYGERALELGCAVSFSGLVFRRGEEASAEVARLVPADRLLIETDSPYLSPPGAPRRRNEPLWVAVTARWLAEQRGADADALGEQLVANFDRIFGAASPGLGRQMTAPARRPTWRARARRTRVDHGLATDRVGPARRRPASQRPGARRCGGPQVLQLEVRRRAGGPADGA